MFSFHYGISFFFVIIIIRHFLFYFLNSTIFVSFIKTSEKLETTHFSELTCGTIYRNFFTTFRWINYYSSAAYEKLLRRHSLSATARLPGTHVGRISISSISLIFHCSPQSLLRKFKHAVDSQQKWSTCQTCHLLHCRSIRECWFRHY